MAKNFVIRAQNNRESFNAVEFKGGADTYTFDLSPWAEDNGTVTGVTWTVEAGQAALSGEALASNVASLLVTTAEPGSSLIKGVATNGTESYVIWLHVTAKDMYANAPDYGVLA